VALNSMHFSSPMSAGASCRDSDIATSGLNDRESSEADRSTNDNVRLCTSDNSPLLAGTSCHRDTSTAPPERAVARARLLCAQVCVPLPPWAMRAGARETIYFNPAEVNVAIVTCGGLCPGLNDVVQGLVSKLTDYGVPDGHILGIKCALCRHHAAARVDHVVHVGLAVQRVRGNCRCSAACRYGYRGFYDRDDKPVVLTRRSVDGIQLQGGTILGTSRGGADIKSVLCTLQRML
jgi:hypothetical protein